MVNPLLDLSWLIGRRVCDVRLERPVSWWFRFGGGGSICAETFWRLILAGRIHTTSGDHDQLFGLKEPVDSARSAIDALSTVLVQQAAATDSGDLILHFDKGTRLEIFSTSSGYESWMLFFPNGDEAIAMGGGSIGILKK